MYTRIYLMFKEKNSQNKYIEKKTQVVDDNIVSLEEQVRMFYDKGR